jgi:hypothetical protein
MTPRRMGRLQYGLSGQLDLAREGRLPKRPRRGGVVRPRCVVRLARLTYRQRECGAGCRMPETALGLLPAATAKAAAPVAPNLPSTAT